MSEQATAPAAPAQAPEAPSNQFVPDTANHAVPGRDFNASIRAIANKTGVAPDAPVAPTPTVTIVRDPVNADGERIIPPATLQPATEPVAEPVAEVFEPASELSVDGGEITLTAQRNADGTYKTKLDPNEKVDFVIKSVIDPVTGKPKVYTKSLPELARMAKDSVTLNQTVQKVQTELTTIKPEVEYYRANVEKWQQNTQSLTEQLEAQKALNLELLTAEDDLVIQRREQYQAEMTPAKQLERLRAERAADAEQKQQTARQAQLTKVASSFMESRIAPALTRAETITSAEAVAGKVTMLTHDLVERGVIPPANWPEMERRINAPDGPFQQWLNAESAKRTTSSDADAAARAALEAERRRAQAVVNADGRLMAPIGRAGPDSAPKLPAPKNSREVLDRIIHRPLPDSVSRSA